MKNHDELKGEIKEGVGKLTEDDEMEREGKLDQAKGKVDDFVDSAADKVEDLTESIKDKFQKE